MAIICCQVVLADFGVLKANNMLLILFFVSH
jgi:hypothetical protein